MKARASWAVLGGLGYVLTLVLIVQLAFANGFLAGVGLPSRIARTGVYNSRLPDVSAVDPDQMSKSVAEAFGGPPTIAQLAPPVSMAVPPSNPAVPLPAARALAPAQRSVPVSAPLPAGIPSAYAALWASLPPDAQSSILTAIQKQGVPTTSAAAAAFFASLPPNVQAEIMAAIQKQAPHD